MSKQAEYLAILIFFKISARRRTPELERGGCTGEGAAGHGSWEEGYRGEKSLVSPVREFCDALTKIGFHVVSEILGKRQPRQSKNKQGIWMSFSLISIKNRLIIENKRAIPWSAS